MASLFIAGDGVALAGAVACVFSVIVGISFVEVGTGGVSRSRNFSIGATDDAQILAIVVHPEVVSCMIFSIMIGE